MSERLKGLLGGLSGIGIFLLVILGFVLLITGGAKLFEAIYPVLEKVDRFIWGLVWILIILSIAPRLRNFTGSGIVNCTYIGGAIFWLLSFYVTYSLWGFVGILIGVMLMGLGVFFTAVLALLFSGQFGPAFYFIFVLVQIYFFRWLGYWIISKYRVVGKSSADELAKLSQSDRL